MSGPGSEHCTDNEILREIDKRTVVVPVGPKVADLLHLFGGAESTARKHISRLVSSGMVQRIGDRSEQLKLTTRGKKAVNGGS